MLSAAARRSALSACHLYYRLQRWPTSRERRWNKRFAGPDKVVSSLAAGVHPRGSEGGGHRESGAVGTVQCTRSVSSVSELW